MEAEFNKKAGSKIEEFERKQEEAINELNRLQAQREESNSPYATPEQEEKIRQLTRERTEYAKAIREQQKELRREKDKLAGQITLLNVAAMPLLVILFGFALFLKRRSSTRAR
jgi:peptidoglycan hydrolase CwlO-like protein